MVSADQAIINELCKIREELTSMRMLSKASESRVVDVYFITVPENGGTREFAAGITKIDFKTGVIVNPDNSIEQLDRRLDLTQDKDVLHSVSIHSDQDLKFRLDASGQQTVDAGFLFQLPYVTYTTLEIECTTTTNANIFACTNPQATLGNFKVTDMTQQSILGDGVELDTFDSISSLLSNLNRIRYQLKTISGETNWDDVPDGDLATIVAMFNATTGHDHDGTDSKKVPAANIVNTPAGNIAATELQSAINELDTEKEPTATAHAARHITGGGDTIANAVAAGNSGLMTGADKTKINSVETDADKTDATNVNAAGATMNSDTDVKANSYVIDENDMASDLDTKVPTQQSVKAYVDAVILPSGMITMWHGLIASIPGGWVICDGNNSTPDLRSKFVRGAPAATEPGTTGGADTHTLTENEMPAHVHDIFKNGATGCVGSVDSSGFSPSATTIIDATDITGGGAAHNNMPAYYEVLFIMKT